MSRTRRGRRVKRRARLFLAQGGRCYLCGCAMTLEGPYRPIQKNFATLDHIIPMAAGGARSALANLALACVPCNQEKGNAIPSAPRSILLPTYHGSHRSPTGIIPTAIENSRTQLAELI